MTFVNPVAEAMTGWKLDEAVGQPLEKIFNIINEQTRAPAPNPVTRVLLDGGVVGLENHTALISRDGTETAIDDSAAPIRDANGTMSGVVMVFHDVTKQRQAETALRESNRSLSEARNDLEIRVQERTAELMTANENLQKLSASLMRAQDDEQRRLARELHDSVGQLLVAIGMNVSIVLTEANKLSPKVAKCVSDNAGLLQQVNKEIRTISHLLHPPLLDEVGLSSALQWYVEGFAERSKIKVDLRIAPDIGRLPNDMEIAIFRIIQECLTNIHRHAGANTAAIHVHREQEQLIVQVEDNGKGIPREKQRELLHSGRTGVGFGGMRERVRQLGGTLEIQSEGNGTIVSAILNTG